MSHVTLPVELVSIDTEPPNGLPTLSQRLRGAARRLRDVTAPDEPYLAGQADDIDRIAEALENAVRVDGSGYAVEATR
jgi:hypothetical protein